MSKADAEATGLITRLESTICGGTAYLRDSPRPDGKAIEGRLYFSRSTARLVAIHAYPGMKTPEGVSLGSTYDQVHTAYPAWKGVSSEDPTTGRGQVAVPDHPGAHYAIAVDNHKVIMLSLESDAQDCYN